MKAVFSNNPEIISNDNPLIVKHCRLVLGMIAMRIDGGVQLSRGAVAAVRKSFDGEPDIVIHCHSHEWQEKWTWEKLLLNPGFASGGCGSSFAILTLSHGSRPLVEKISLG